MIITSRTAHLKISGYTLLEVMVSLIIIGISVTAITGALSTAKGLSARSDNALESIRILKNILNNPELMKQIKENRYFEKVLEDEDGWVCGSETNPLIIDSAELLWDNDNIGGFYSYSSSKTEAKQKRKLKNGVNNRKKVMNGEEIEIPGMVDVTICIKQNNQTTNKEYCVNCWKRLDNLLDNEVITKPVEKEVKVK